MQTTNNQQPTTCKRIAFIVSKFPCVDETFILQELAVLDENGFDFDIYSIKKSRDRVIQTQAANLVDRLIYRNFIFSTAVLKAQLYFLKTNPIRYIKTWLSFVGQMWRTPWSLLKCLVLYPKAVCY
ncbi:MAG: hypothetical protein ACE5I1_14485 [bacterium]